ncbi:nickel ABC transporter substrate-binding protein [Ectobacillus panaciterrae]|uniref:nickel ABC transporter substrate-binding protein n=1 Tax=Ectobacillus panaciterrae TaxID=363872 RepID=UPI0003F64082|nr:nickel ABC transporter substrate-binding protein [Ectobacillus panaciterrae]
MKKLYIVFLIALMLAISACSNNSSTKSDSIKEKHLNILFSFPSSTLDPVNDWTTSLAGITETLIKMDENLEMKPLLATSWKQVDDATWTFDVRDGVTFHNGDKLTAEAVKQSLELAIKHSPKLENSLKIKEMSADGQILTIKTKEPFPSLPSELINPSTSIIDAKAFNEMGATKFNKAPVGTGPFTVDSFKPDVEIELKPFKDYWDGASPLNSVTFKFNADGNVRAMALQSMDTDIAYNLPTESLSTIPKDEINIESIESLRSDYILYNMHKPVFQDVKVRKAFDLLINRQEAADEIMSGHATPTSSPFSSNLPFGSEKTVVKQDLQKAKALLEEAGYKMNANKQLEKDGKPLSVKMMTFQSRPQLPLISQLLQSEAAKVGIKIDIQTTDNIDSYLFEKSDWDLATYSNLTAPRGDAGYFLNIAYLADGALNPGGVNIPSLNDTISELNRTSEQNKRNEITKKAVSIIEKEVPQSFIIHPHLIVGINKKVENFKPGQAEFYLLTNKVDIKEK